MSFNGNLQKYIAVAVILGSIFAIITFSILLNATQLTPQGPNPPVAKGIGAKIAEGMETNEDNISYIWCYNNTWTNLNLSAHYEEFIDGVRIGLVDQTPTAALIHEPTANFAEIDQLSLNNIMADFRNSISVLNDTSTSFDDLIEIWPPTFLIDIAYEDNTSVSIIYSQEHNLISVVNGTWTLSEYLHHGIYQVIMDYSSDSFLFFPLDDPSLILTALENFANLIYTAFP
jgi:hypothetical protein